MKDKATVAAWFGVSLLAVGTFWAMIEAELASAANQPADVLRGALVMLTVMIGGLIAALADRRIKAVGRLNQADPQPRDSAGA